ncbi:MAG: YgiQ family radical SAM protein, partial [Bacteroidota bacterium]
PIYTAKTPKQKKNQHLFFFWYKRENQQRIKDKLVNMGRPDLVEKLLTNPKKFKKKEIIKAREQQKPKKRFNPKSKRNRRR